MHRSNETMICVAEIVTAMKRGDEELNASSLQFLRSVKSFIASLLQIFSQQ
jgi:hypothetical protein